jgi:hypothetical protein
MTSEDYRGLKVSRKEAQLEIENHGLLFADFVADCGYKEVYISDEVLNWLGY